MQKVHWVIPCPVCGKRLRVLDQSMLGRRGQCPSCRHKFELEVPKSAEYTKKHGESGAPSSAPEDTLRYDYDFEIPSDQNDTSTT